MLHPALEKRDDRLHPSLLEHNFGYPNNVGVRMSTPGQTARVLSIPVEKRLSQVCGHN
jgi:hypothetical protein